MKVLVIGSDKIFAIENFYVKYLRELGAKVYHFPAQSLFYDYYQRNFINKISFKSGLSNIYQNINQQLRKIVTEVNPDIIWVFKGMEIFPESLKWADELGIKLVNFNADNPFLFSGRGSGNKNVTASIGLYHLHFTYNIAVKARLEKTFNAKTAWLPFGFDISDNVFKMAEQQEEICQLCFLGNPDKMRSAFILALADQEIQISVYGNDWNKFLTHSNIAIHSPVYGDDLWKVLRKYRVQLNLMRPHNDDSHNMRTFEVPGVGGIMVAPDTAEHQIFFEDKKEVFLFKDILDCARQIKELIQLPLHSANELRNAARTRSINSRYSYNDRAQQSLHHLQQLISE